METSSNFIISITKSIPELLFRSFHRIYMIYLGCNKENCLSTFAFNNLYQTKFILIIYIEKCSEPNLGLIRMLAGPLTHTTHQPTHPLQLQPQSKSFIMFSDNLKLIRKPHGPHKYNIQMK